MENAAGAGKSIYSPSMKVILESRQLESEPDIAVVGTKGQIVIPLQLRRRLKITPKSRLAVYSRGDKLVMTKLRLQPLGEELKELFKEIDEAYKGRRRPSRKAILKEIQAYRQEKRAG
ncbi:MAG: AbrB/MazE/SpoVT family DNA-binding domain-containing protein [Thaumarchaeota archaeon]|nr:MAG: AbrB/MazE/SpoVT family DNA-binding domain-containing protein [Nitrososphaerota archaeon]